MADLYAQKLDVDRTGNAIGFFMKRGWRIATISLAVLAGFLLVFATVIGPNGRAMTLYAASVLIYGISDAGQVEECSKIVDMFLQRHDIPKTSKSKKGYPPVFCTPGASGLLINSPPTVIIYEARTQAAQEQYLATVRSVQHEIGSPKIGVEFYEAENWIEWKSDRASGGERGPERLLRKEVLAR
jgi:hypothetical protein